MNNKIYDMSGCYILRQRSHEILEKAQQYLNKLLKAICVVKNYKFSLFVSKKDPFLKEKELVEGFSLEVAWVTKSGKGEIDLPIAIRPTSETKMYPAFPKWKRSHRDLHLSVNQWTNEGQTVHLATTSLFVKIGFYSILIIIIIFIWLD